MEGKEEDVSAVDTEEVVWDALREKSQEKVHEQYSTRLYCGKCDTECDYFGVNPQKILGFICHVCHEFNDVDSDDTEDDRWIYATNQRCTVTANIREGRTYRISPIAWKMNGLTPEQFAEQFKPTRMYVFTTRKDW